MSTEFDSVLSVSSACFLQAGAIYPDINGWQRNYKESLSGFLLCSFGDHSVAQSAIGFEMHSFGRSK